MEDGVQIIEEQWMTPGEKGHYIRWEVTCPYHPAVNGLPCRKRRNIGASQTAWFGKWEPAAYLIAWLRNGPFYADLEHCRCPSAHPKKVEIEAVMREQGWLT